MHVKAIWARLIDDKIQVLFEGDDGKWRVAIEENVRNSFSHIAEGSDLEAAPEDQITGNPYWKNGQEWVTAP